MTTINLQNKLSRFSEHWSPHQIAVVNDMHVLLAKLKDNFVWHKHDEEDELFQVIKGTLYMQLKDETGIRIEIVKEGELIVVPKGVEHNPMTKNNEEVHGKFYTHKEPRKSFATYMRNQNKLYVNYGP